MPDIPKPFSCYVIDKKVAIQPVQIESGWIVATQWNDGHTYQVLPFSPGVPYSESAEAQSAAEALVEVDCNFVLLNQAES